MAKVSAYYGTRYLSPADLDGPLVGVITDCRPEEIEGREGEVRERIVITVDGVRKDIVINATNADTLICTWGDETEAWVGKRVSVRKGKVLFGGKKIDSIILGAAT